jgi:hypothetical protein
MVSIKPRPGDRLGRDPVSGEWVIFNAKGEIIHRDLYLSQADVDKLIAMLRKELGS